jgi:hypothetical protein
MNVNENSGIKSSWLSRLGPAWFCFGLMSAAFGLLFAVFPVSSGLLGGFHRLFAGFSLWESWMLIDYFVSIQILRWKLVSWGLSRELNIAHYLYFSLSQDFLSFLTDFRWREIMMHITYFFSRSTVQRCGQEKNCGGWWIILCRFEFCDGNWCRLKNLKTACDVTRYMII